MNNNGVAYTFAAIDLTEYEMESVIGPWDVRVEVNGAEVSQVTFEIQPRSQEIPSFPPFSFLIGVMLFLYLLTRESSSFLI